MLFILIVDSQDWKPGSKSCNTLDEVLATHNGRRLGEVTSLNTINIEIKDTDKNMKALQRLDGIKSVMRDQGVHLID